jgi:hypothetical protein
VSRCRPSPCDRLSRPPSTATAPPRPGAKSGRRACPSTDWLSAEEGDAGSLPTFTGVHCDGVGAQLHPDGIARTAHRSLGSGLLPHIGWMRQEREGDRLALLPAPQHDPSIRVCGSLTTHGASITGSVPLHLSVFACGHRPSDGADPSLRCQGCSWPCPRPGVQPALSFCRPLRRSVADLSSA